MLDSHPCGSTLDIHKGAINDGFIKLKDGYPIFAIMREYRYYFSLSSLEEI